MTFYTHQDERVADFHLLGTISFDDCVRLQRRLVYDIGNEACRRLVVLLCEHPSIVSVGRRGSRAHIRLTSEELRRRQLSVRWVNRGGGCVLHAPGQLAAYAVVPLARFGWKPGPSLRRLQIGIASALHALGIETEQREGSPGLWGRSGMLAAAGSSVRDATSCQGAFVNVAPNMASFGFIDTAAPYVKSGEKATMSCLLAEKRQPVKMASIRASLIEQLTCSFECDRHNIHAGHPWLRQRVGSVRESIARAS